MIFILKKMITEHCQILSTVWRYTSGIDGILEGKKTKYLPQLGEYNNGDKVIYLMFNPKHPSCLWTTESKSNYQELSDLTYAMFQEYYYRNGKHISNYDMFMTYLKDNIPTGIVKVESTKMKRAINIEEIAKIEDVNDAYKTFMNYKYKEWLTRTDKKVMIPTWTKRELPSWLDDDVRMILSKYNVH